MEKSIFSLDGFVSVSEFCASRRSVTVLYGVQLNTMKIILKWFVMEFERVNFICPLKEKGCAISCPNIIMPARENLKIGNSFVNNASILEY